MRKKFLAVLLALVMVIGILPITALAAELTEAQKKALKDQGYTDEEIANVMVIDEDTEISEDYDGLIVVVGSVNVTVKGANIGVGLVVAPGAAGAKITLGENAVVNAVIALEKSDITVSETAQANSVTAVAADTVVTVDGTVSNLGAANTAENVTIKVTAKANVSTVTMAAPNAKAEIAGTVGTVNVEATAEGASLKVAETGKVTTASVAAPNTEVTVDGDVTTVDVAETATGAQVGGANADKVEVTGATDKVTTATDNGTVEVGVGGTIEVGDNHLPIPSIKAAPLGDKSQGNIVYAPKYGVNVAKNTDNDKKFDVTIVGKIPQHWSSNTNYSAKAGGFVGIAIPVPTKTTTDSQGKTTVQKTMDYNYYVIKTDVVRHEDGTETSDTKIYVHTGAYWVGDDQTGSDMQYKGITNASLYALYDTIYFTQLAMEKMSKDGHTVTAAEASASPSLGSTGDVLKTTRYEIIALDASKDALIASQVQALDASGNPVVSNSQPVQTAVVAPKVSDGVPVPSETAAVSNVLDKVGQEAYVKAYNDAVAAGESDSNKLIEIATAAKNAAMEKVLYDAAEQIFNIKVEASAVPEEYINVGDASTPPSLMSEAPSARPGTPSAQVITAPKGTFQEGNATASPEITPSMGDAAGVEKDTTPSSAPTYNTTISPAPGTNH